MTTKLAAHVQAVGGNVDTWLETAQPEYVKWLVFDIPRLQAVKNRGGKNIIRCDFGINACDVDAMIRKIASFQTVYGSLIDYLELWNEPPINDGAIKTLNAATIAVLNAVKAPIIIGSVSVGNPKVLADWVFFAPAIRTAMQYGGGLGLHEYSAPTMESGGWLTLRYRRMLQVLPSDCQNVPIFLTEVGEDGGILNPPQQNAGWQHFTDEAGYLAELQWYDTEIQKDPQVRCATIFTVGSFDPFKSFDVADALSIARYIRANQEKPVTKGIGRVDGFDISNNNGTVDWTLAGDCGKTFVGIKRSEGLDFVDDTFDDHWKAASDYGLVRIAYDYGRPSSTSGHEEAKRFVDLVKDWRTGDIPALDLEDPRVPVGAGLGDYAVDWHETVRGLLKTAGVLYTGEYYVLGHGMGADTRLANYGLWIAAYQSTAPISFAPWPFWAIWQFSQGTIPGISVPCDMDLFNGTADELRRYGVP